MPNKANTVGFASTCPDHLEVWRRAAARQAADDKYTVLWTELVTAFKAQQGPLASNAQLFQGFFFDGLVRAYALLTGDTDEAVLAMVLRSEVLDREAVAPTEAVPVPS